MKKSARSVKLSPKVARLLHDETERCNRLPETKSRPGRKRVTPDAIANEILWLALREGDISL